MPISWVDSIEPAHIVTAVAVMPHGVPQPPADFDWLHNTWPAPKPTLDIAKVLQNLQAIAQVGQQLTTLASDLAKDVSAIKQEV